MNSVLHLGCGRTKRPGAIGADINPASDADVRCDLDAPAFPFATGTFEYVICEHVLEHLENVIKVMEEIHRVSKPDATVLVQVPHFSSVHYYADPTHKHPFALHSFDYFVEGAALHGFSYSPARFQVMRAEFPPPASARSLKRATFGLINRHKDWYEKHLSFILPRHLVEFELRVLKDRA